MENEIVMSEETMETTEETTGRSGKGLKILGGIGLAAAVSLLAYKFVVKPVSKKIKAKKAAKKSEPEIRVIDSGDRCDEADE